MLVVSDDFKTAMKSPVKELQAYIIGDSSIRSEDDLISFKISCDSGLCKTAMRKLEAKYIGEHNLLGQWVYVGFGVKLPTGAFDYLDYGSFLVTEITTSKDTGTTSIVGYDKMINSMTNYKKLEIEYPISLYDYTKLLCEACNLVLGNESFFTHNDWQITQELWENIDGITYRDILVQIAQVTGTTCIISNDNKVYFKSLTDTGETLTYDNMFKLKLEPLYGEINSVVLGRDPIVGEDVFIKDDESIATNGLTEYRISNNEIVDKDRESAIEPIYNALKGISYYPFEATTEGLGWYEIGDKVNIVNDTGDVYNTSLFNLNITMDAKLKETLKTVAETKTQSQYQYATTISKRVKNTEILVNKQEQYIQQLVTDVYNEGGIINENFTQVYQDIDNIVNSVQTSGGNNLIKNSVMFAYNSDYNPTNWDTFDAPINLCSNSWEIGDYSISTGQKVTYDTRVRLTDLLKVQPNKKYFFKTNIGLSFIICCYDKDKNFLQSLGAIGTDKTLTISDNVYFIGVSLYDPSDSTRTGEDIKSTIDGGTIKPYISLEENKDNNYTSYNQGDLIIDSNTESLNAGCSSGHSFTLLDKIVTQKVNVSNNTYYTFSTRIKKNKAGNCYVKLYNTNEEHIIEIPSGEEVFYKEFEVKALLPKDNYYIVEFYGSADSEATFTDNMLAVGEYKTQWTQANGEIMNTQVNVNLDGVLVKSSVYLGDYTVMSPLEFAGYSNINGTITKVFSLNKDTTLVKKLEAEDEVKMVPIKIIPITTGDLQGWAFVPST